MLRKYVLRPIFVSAFAIFVALFFVVSSNSTESFNFFKVRTAQQNLKIGSKYVKIASVDTPVIGTVLAQIKVGNGKMYGAHSRGDALSLQSEAEHIVNTDILALLRNSSDPDAVLELHTGKTEQLIQDMDATYDSLWEIAQDKQRESDDCLERKREGDQEFFVGVNNRSEIEYLAGLEKSKEFAPCYITNRIEANANRYLAERAVAYKNILTQRNTTLTLNHEDLVGAYPLLHGDIAEKMVNLKRTLNQVNSTSFENFEDHFNFMLPGADGSMPSLQNVWFRDNNMEIPTYIDPLQGLGKEISAK